MTTKIRTAIFAAIILFAVGAAGACGLFGGGEINQSTVKVNKDAASSVALKGFDPTAYFTDNQPVQGKPEFVAEHNGAKYQFASAATRDLFVKNPEKYAPQYGGYCAWAVSKGYTADIDPSTGKVVDGKLYLNYNPDVAKKWNEDIPKYISNADKNWRETDLKHKQ